MVNADHQMTMRVRTRRAPIFSPHHALTISNAGIGDGEGAEHEAHLQLGEIEIAGDLGRQRGDADPVEIGDSGKEEEEAACLVTGPCGLHEGEGWSLSRSAGEDLDPCEEAWR